jgi:hypothetical protein
MEMEIPKVTVVQPAQPPVIAEEPKSVDPVAVPQAAAEVDPKSQESFSKRFSALNRERKMVDQKAAEIKKKEAELQAKESQFKEWEEKQRSIKEAKNPIAALQAFGYSYEDAAQYLLNDQKPTADLQIKSVEEKVQELQKKLEEKEKIALEHQQKLLEAQNHEENKKAIGAIKTHLEANPEFDALVALGMEDDIFKRINDHYNHPDTQGEVLQIDDLAKEMLEQVEKMLGVVTKTTLYKNKFAPQHVAPVKEAPKTLNNKLGAQTVPSEKKHYKSDEERVRNAIALLSK